MEATGVFVPFIPKTPNFADAVVVPPSSRSRVELLVKIAPEAIDHPAFPRSQEALPTTIPLLVVTQEAVETVAPFVPLICSPLAAATSKLMIPAPFLGFT